MRCAVRHVLSTVSIVPRTSVVKGIRVPHQGTSLIIFLRSHTPKYIPCFEITQLPESLVFVHRLLTYDKVSHSSRAFSDSSPALGCVKCHLNSAGIVGHRVQAHELFNEVIIS